MKKKYRSGLFLLGLIAAVLVLLPSAQAVDFKISGQINRAILWGDNGDESDVKFVDNDNSSTRFRFTGENDFDESWKAGIVWEVQMESNSSSDQVIDISNNGDNDTSDVNFTERKIEFFVGHKKLGRVWLGQGDTASNGTSEVDLSGTDVVAYSSIADMAGGFSFRDSDGEVILTREGGPSRIGNTFDNYDGFSRRDRIRYDTPTFWGFYASAGYMNGQSYDFALRSAHQWDNFGKLAAAVALLPAETQRDDFTQVNGSVSFLHNSGINLTFSGGYRDWDSNGRNSSSNLYGKIGYKRGKWAFSVDGTQSERRQQDGDEATSFSAAVVWNVWESVEFYGCYRWHELDRDREYVDSGTGVAQNDPQDINAVMIGGRVKF